MKKTNTKQNREPVKKYLFIKRAAIIKKLYSNGYSFADIGIIFNVDRSWIKRIVDKK